MANTYELINSSVLGSGTASVTFSAIPATYDDLSLRVSTRSSSGGAQNYFVSLNSIAADYSTVVLWGNGSSLTSLNYTSQSSYRAVQQINGSDSASNTFSNGEIYIPRYKDSVAKPCLIHSVQEDTDAVGNSVFAAGYLNNTAVITSVTISTAGLFVANSSFYLYGIKNS